jgi:hypothetical protein
LHVEILCTAEVTLGTMLPAVLAQSMHYKCVAFATCIFILYCRMLLVLTGVC